MGLQVFVRFSALPAIGCDIYESKRNNKKEEKEKTDRTFHDFLLFSVTGYSIKFDW